MDRIIKQESHPTDGDGKRKHRKIASQDDALIESPASSNRSKRLPGFSVCCVDLSSREVKKSIGRFFYESGLHFNAVNSTSFQNMISICSEVSKFQVPTCEELKGWIFNDISKEMHEYINTVKSSWVETGCTIMLDGWIDEHGRNLVSILADCPKGTIYIRSADLSDFLGDKDLTFMFLDRVLTEVGVDHVVQIMTCSTSVFMRDVGKQLMQKYRGIFWTASATCCIELMLEKLGRTNLVNDVFEKVKAILRFIGIHPIVFKFLHDKGVWDLIKQSRARSAQPFLILENLLLHRGSFQKMFEESDGKGSILKSTDEGKVAAKIIGDQVFWNDASIVLEGSIPLIRVMDWMYADDMDQMGCIYETIDQVKETIRKQLKLRNRESEYQHFWKVIDQVWNEFLYSHLHSTGYYLNPNIFYTDDFHVDAEITSGVFSCLVRSTKDYHVHDQLAIQLEKYQAAGGSFGAGCTREVEARIPSVRWWSKYGGDGPELQRLAIRIFSQRCDGPSKFLLLRSAAKAVLNASGRDYEEQKRLSDMVFLQYNLHLKNFNRGSDNHFKPNPDNTDLDWVFKFAWGSGSAWSDEKKWMELEG